MNADDMPDPLPCPFCGSLRVNVYGSFSSGFVKCRMCQASGPAAVGGGVVPSERANETAAIEAWNSALRLP